MAKIYNIPIEVALPPSEEMRLRDRLMEEDGSEILIKVMMNIDSSKAEATMEQDKENIRRLIETEVEGGYMAVVTQARS